MREPGVTPQVDRAQVARTEQVDGTLVHVWRADLAGATAPDPESVLSGDELERAARFVFELDRERFAAARAALRHVLARYCGESAGELRFHYAPRGKPQLAARHGGIQFNLSHTGDCAVIAVTRAGPVGIDIEPCNRVVHLEAVAQRYFAPEEIATLFSLPETARQRAFLTCWTRKEAYIKAHADGLWRPLDSFVVTVAPDEPARVVATRPDTDEAAHWLMQDLEVGADHVAALALRASAVIVEYKGAPWIT